MGGGGGGGGRGRGQSGIQSGEERGEREEKKENSYMISIFFLFSLSGGAENGTRGKHNNKN